jgi:hypothetical protein
MPREYLNSPLNQTYSTNSILASATIEISERVYTKQNPDWIEFYLDGGTENHRTFRVPATQFGNSSDGWLVFHGETMMDVPDGDHRLEIGFRSSQLGTVYPAIVYFRVEANNPNASVLSISVLSPATKTYNDSSIPLSFAVNEPISSAKYYLNSQSYSTSTNTTLINLPNGQYNLTVCVTDLGGRVGVSETVYFTVELPEAFPTTLVAAISAVGIAAFSVGMVVYFKKRKHSLSFHH